MKTNSNTIIRLAWRTAISAAVFAAAVPSHAAEKEKSHKELTGCAAGYDADHRGSYDFVKAVYEEAADKSGQLGENLEDAAGIAAQIKTAKTKATNLEGEFKGLVDDWKRIRKSAADLTSDDPSDDLLRAVKAADERGKRALDSLADLTGNADGDEAGWKELVGKIETLKQSFDSGAEEVRQLIGSGEMARARVNANNKKWTCIRDLNRNYGADLERKYKLDSGSSVKNMAQILSDAKDDGVKLDEAMRGIVALKEEVDEFPREVAEKLKVKTLTVDGLVKCLEDRSAPRIRIRFLNDGTEIKAMDLKKDVPDVQAGDTIEEKDVPPGPPRAGAKFLYWGTGAYQDKFTDWGKPFAKDQEFHAVWGWTVTIPEMDNKKYEVPLNGRSNPDYQTLFGDPDFAAFEDELRKKIPRGREFAGWREKGGSPVDASDKITRDVTLEPWDRAAVRTAKWRDEAGRLLSTRSVPYGDKLAKENFPDNPAFNYLYWSLEPGGEEWNGWDDPLERDIELYAVGDKKLQVTLKNAAGEAFQTFPTEKGKPFALASIVAKNFRPDAPEGKAFRHWMKDGKPAPDSFVVEDDVELEPYFDDQNASEQIEAAFAPIKRRFGTVWVAAADVVLLALMFPLAFGGRVRAPRKPKKAKPAEPAVTPDAGEEPASGAAGAESGPETGEQA